MMAMSLQHYVNSSNDIESEFSLHLSFKCGFFDFL